VTTELEHINRYFPSGPSNHQLTESLATCDAVAAAMATHEWIHFACHAGPLGSGKGAEPGFVLSDGDLTITDLAAQPGQSGGLAFLSACQTATGSEDHPDEALHLAAAMQFLGYSHVIATMWSIADSPAPRFADLFYTALCQDGNGAASALQYAVSTLRDESDPADPFIWAPTRTLDAETGNIYVLVCMLPTSVRPSILVILSGRAEFFRFAGKFARRTLHQAQSLQFWLAHVGHMFYGQDSLTRIP